MALPVIALAGSLASAGTSIYAARQQSKDAEAAAKFNAKEARRKAGVASEDARENALRNQESNRKYLASVRTSMLEKSQTIEGADADFLDEATGNLQLRILDESVRTQRVQAGFQNEAFRYDAQASNLRSARPIQTATGVIGGFNSVFSAGKSAGFWGSPKRLTSAQPNSVI